VSTEKDIRPISITPIAATLFESIIMKCVDEAIEGKIDAKQFYGIDIIPLSISPVLPTLPITISEAAHLLSII